MLSRESSIHEIAAISDILNFVKKDSWLFVDFDNTLEEPLSPSGLGSDQWFVKLVEYACALIPDNEEAIAAVLAIYHEVHHHIKMKAVEADIVEIISTYQNQGLPVIGITARDEIIKNDTIRQLEEIGINFNGKIIFCGGKNKGTCFKDFLENCNILPSHVVMVDDKKKHVIHVMEAALSIGIQCTGLRYNFLDTKVENMDMAAAHVELTNLKPELSRNAKASMDKLNISNTVLPHSFFRPYDETIQTKNDENVILTKVQSNKRI